MMKLEVLDGLFSVCRVKSFDAELLNQPFVFLVNTDEERSLVCPAALVPANATDAENGWRGFRLAGVLDFSLVGILSSVTGLLAKEGIGLFAVSTFNTDYVFVKEENFDRALAVLAEGGYQV